MREFMGGYLKRNWREQREGESGIILFQLKAHQKIKQHYTIFQNPESRKQFPSF